MKVLVTAYYLILSASTLVSAPQVDTGDVPAETVQDYVLGPGDLVSVWVADAEELSTRPLRIDQGGTIRMPLVGQVEAAGLSPRQLEAELVNRLGKYMKKPQVTVTVTEYRSQPVSVLGAVHTPGVQQLQGPSTLLELLSMAGGVTEHAGAVVQITRQGAWGPIPLKTARSDGTGRFSVAEVSLRPLLAAEAPETNIAIRPHDVISVPRAQMVYVVGEVTRAGGFVLNERKTMSALEALAMAGGLLKTASPGKAKILRLENGGAERKETPVNLKKVVEGKAMDLALQPNDILFIPSSTSKRAAVRAVEALVQTATGVVVWRGAQW